MLNHRGSNPAALGAVALSIVLVAGCGKSEPEAESQSESEPQSIVQETPDIESQKPQPLEAQPDQLKEEEANTQQIVLPELVFDVPDAWQQEDVASSMRVAQFKLNPPDGSEVLESASLVVYDFGSSGAGDVQSNFRRWAAQVEQPDGTPSMDRADQWTVEMGKITVHDLEVAGTYIAETSPGSGMRVNKPDYKLIATIVETPNRPYYFKLTGPQEVVDAWKPAYMKMIDSFRVPGDESGGENGSVGGSDASGGDGSGNDDGGGSVGG